MKLTLTAFYGPKPPQLARFVAACQHLVSARAPLAFRPYEVPQVHATIVGLEGRRVEHVLLNENWLRIGESRAMDILGALDFLATTERLPFQVRIGGFGRDHDYPFTSFGRHPYERSFEVQSNNAVVAIGWPVAGARFTRALYELRCELSRFNVLHKYHVTPGSEDNDLFFVLGTIDGERAPQFDRAAVSADIRAELAAMEPLVLDVELACLSLVRYEDARLPPATSVQAPLAESERLIAGLLR